MEARQIDNHGNTIGRLGPSRLITHAQHSATPLRFLYRTIRNSPPVSLLLQLPPCNPPLLRLSEPLPAGRPSPLPVSPRPPCAPRTASTRPSPRHPNLRLDSTLVSEPSPSEEVLLSTSTRPRRTPWLRAQSRVHRQSRSPPTSSRRRRTTKRCVPCSPECRKAPTMLTLA